MNFVLKTRNFVFKIMDFAENAGVNRKAHALTKREARAMREDLAVARRVVGSCVMQYHEFCIQHEELCIHNEDFCIENDEFCRYRMMMRCDFRLLFDCFFD